MCRHAVEHAQGMSVCMYTHERERERERNRVRNRVSECYYLS